MKWVRKRHIDFHRKHVDECDGERADENWDELGEWRDADGQRLNTSHTHTDSEIQIFTRSTRCAQEHKHDPRQIIIMNFVWYGKTTLRCGSVQHAFSVQTKFIISIFTQSLMQRLHFRQHFGFFHRIRRKNNQLWFVCEFHDWRMLFSPVLFAQINDVRWYSRLPSLFDVARCVRWIRVMIIFTHFLVFWDFICFLLFNWTWMWECWSRKTVITVDAEGVKRKQKVNCVFNVQTKRESLRMQWETHISCLMGTWCIP